MFNDKDYKDYFEEIRRVEIMMLGRAKDMATHFKDEADLKLIEVWRNDEVRHKHLAEGLIEMIK